MDCTPQRVHFCEWGIVVLDVSNKKEAQVVVKKKSITKCITTYYGENTSNKATLNTRQKSYARTRSRFMQKRDHVKAKSSFLNQ